MCLFALVSCKKGNLEINNLNGDRISIMGHGGMGITSTYPLNSFESISHCLRKASDGTELDVQMTSDSVLVAFHDRTLDNSTNISGNIYTKTWAQIQGATYVDPPFANYHVVRLDDIFTNLDQLKSNTFILDVKGLNPDESPQYANRLIDAIIRFIDHYDLVENILVELKRPDLISALKSKRPEIAILANLNFEMAFAIAEQYDLTGISVAVDEISKEQVELAHDLGIIVSVFNTHSTARNFEAIEKNVDFIVTDKLSHLIRVLKD